MLQGADIFFFPGTAEFDYKKLGEARAYLRDLDQANLSSLEDHRSYVELVSKFRTLIEEVTKQNGDRFLETIKRLLSVGDDGLYTNRMRFLFELIQNVDDCDYELGITPKLIINFDVNNRKLILRYNELGFTPRNVFSITGIAEEAKNIDERKLQIGEKGIGFKSVFGVANSVLIRSGLFSFRLNRDHFTIPIPEYSDGFNGIKGTELTLEFDSDVTLGAVMESVMERYRKDNALFTQNPIVFLNKLNGLEFKSGDEQLLSFSVVRPPAEKIGDKGLSVCRGMTLSLHRKGRPDRPISGTCYTTTVKYSRTDCQSRYGADTALNSRELRIEAFFPDPSFVISDSGKGSIEHGLMYSFLPTQVELEVPLICHAPFKLDASREYVDSQYKNAWFRKTITALSAFIHSCYRLQAIQVQEVIIAYIPRYAGFPGNFFGSSKHNAKMDDLLKTDYGLSGEAIGREKIFYCSDGAFHAADEIVSFVKCEEIEQPVEVLRLCAEQRPFFRSPAGFYPGGYHIPVIENPYERLFFAVFSDREIGLADARKAVEIIKKSNKAGLLHDACRDAAFEELNENHLIALHDAGALRTLVDALVLRVKGERCSIDFHRMSGYVRPVFELMDQDTSIGYEDMGAHASSYFQNINGYCLVLDNVFDDGFCVPAENVCVVAGEDPSAWLIDLCRKLDPDSLFSVRLKLKKASAKLDAAMTTDNPREFLGELRNIRIASKEAMGGRAYKSYLDLIQKSGTSAGRYVNELLQNADDCDYPNDTTPSVEIKAESDALIVTTNEVGFKATNVRAITAIGESTKNLVLGNNVNKLKIGEKGVGFKSVFAIADSVEIHSGGFDFVLNADTPTIPALLPEVKDQIGTRMRFKLRRDFTIPQITEQDVLDLCVCLRNIKDVKLYGHHVQIEDPDVSFRRVTVNGTPYEFLVCEHAFEIRDSRALESRNAGGKKISPRQKIRCYVPTAIRCFEHQLYCGLPLKVKTCAPLIIDAPFELTTARDAVLEESKWNEYVRDNVYTAILKTAEMIKDQLRINVLHLFGVEHAEQNNGRLTYCVKMFEGVGDRFLNGVTNFIDRVRCAEIIPVKSSADVFLCPEDGILRVFPQFLSDAYDAATDVECPFERVDLSNGQEIKQLRQVLEALTVQGLDEEEFWDAIEKLGDLSGLMVNEEFRDGVYGFLRKLGDVMLAGGRPIVPVVKEDGLHFVCADDGRFFYSEEHRVSTEKYFIVNTDMMDREAYEAIFGEELKEMNAAQEREFYCNAVSQYLRSHDVGDRYAYLLKELKGPNSENLQLCMPNVQRQCKNMIPLKNRNGEILCQRMFGESRGGSVVRGQILKAIVIDPECANLAMLLDCPTLSQIGYRDLPNDPWEMSRDDVIDIKDGNISNKDDILLLAVRDGRISEELAIEFGLTSGLASDVGDEYEFPTEPLRNLQGLKAHIREFLNNPTRIVSKQVMRAVDFCVPANGKEFELSSREARQSALRRYSPYGHTEVCFCQMCRSIKRVGFVEVNCIEKTPKFYFPELRLTLCLECSKKFELLRNSKSFYEDFIGKLMRLSASNDEDNVLLQIPLPGNERFKLLFTRTHLAEIQEILKGKLALEAERRFRSEIK